MDSNHDYLIQSQAGYRYPTGQSSSEPTIGLRALSRQRVASMSV